MKDDVLLLRDYRSEMVNSAQGEASPLTVLILHATWIEHWVNKMIAVQTLALGIEQEETKGIIRDTPLRGKLTWLLKLLGLPPIEKKHLSQINEIMDARNAYVHYKWQLRDWDGFRTEEARIRSIVDRLPDTRGYLTEHEEKFPLIEQHRATNQAIVEKLFNMSMSEARLLLG